MRFEYLKMSERGAVFYHLEYNKEEEFCWRINKTRPKDGLIVEMTATLLKKNAKPDTLTVELVLCLLNCCLNLINVPDQLSFIYIYIYIRKFISLQLHSIHNLVTIL
jgi:hypothetical protein